MIKNNELVVFLPFSNAFYVNNWSTIVQKSNPRLVKKMMNETIQKTKEHKNLQDLSHWYANNCIFMGDKMRFEYGEKPLRFIQEGDKTIVPLKHFLLEFLEHYPKEKASLNIEFFFNPRDFPVLRHDYKEPYDKIFGKQKIEKEYQHDSYTPILSQSGHTEYHDIPVPTEDDMMRITDKIYPETCKNNYQNKNNYELDFHKKKSKCIFRGSATGCGITRETNMRLHACLLSHEWSKTKHFHNDDREDVLDAKLTGWNRKPKMSEGKLNEIVPMKVAPKDFIVGKENFMDLEKQSTYKYILNIDGHVKAFRLGNELRMGSVILLVESPYILWFQKFMEPKVHYIPVKADLNDLEDQLTWCLSHDKECETIAKNSIQFYDTYLTKEKTFEYFGQLIESLSHIRKEPTFTKNNNHMNLIVAYRDSGDNYRSKQLSVFIEQMLAIFNPLTTIHIIIVEQESEREDYDTLPNFIQQEKSKMAKFNLGRLKNIGYTIASQSKNDNQYFILSDVDLIPSQELIPMYLQIPENPIHLGNKGTRYEKNQDKDKDETTFLGGVVSFSAKDFIESNGYPNNFWGWGGEDDALNHRLQENKIKITLPDAPVIDLEELSLQKKLQSLKEQKVKEKQKWEKVENDKQIWKENGLSSLDDTYTVKNQTKYKGLENVDHYFVELTITEQDKKILTPIQ